jgi:hypothetical protein
LCAGATHSHAVLTADIIAREENEYQRGLGGSARARGGDDLAREEVLHVKPHTRKQMEK